jgi:tripartite ATP-independent transporter DctM subunit
VSGPLWVLAAVFVGGVVVRFPIAHTMFAAGICYLVASAQDIAVLVDQVLTSMLTMYVLLAIPMFIFAANLMNAATISERLWSAADALVGRWRGGLGHVSILVSVAFSSMSGSAISDAAGPGMVSVRMMRDVARYPAGFSVALVAAAATIAPIIPPSIIMVIYALLSNASVGALFLGGIVPGLLMAVALMIAVFFAARRLDLPRGQVMPPREVPCALAKAFVPMTLPVVLLGGIWGGFFTPTEAAAVAGFYALLLGALVYRRIRMKQFVAIVHESVTATTTVMLLIAGAFIVNFAITNEQLADRFAHLFQAAQLSQVEFLLLVNLAFVILGCFLDTAVLLLVFVPVLLPSARALGVDLVHFGVVITVNMMIGMITPPYGLLLLVMSSLVKVPIAEIVRAIWQFILPLVLVLLLFVLVPETVTWLPQQFGFR